MYMEENCHSPTDYLKSLMSITHDNKTGNKHKNQAKIQNPTVKICA